MRFFFRRFSTALLPLSFFVLVSSCATSTTAGKDPPASVPPLAAVEPKENQYHGQSVKDPYQWLEAGDQAAVKSYIDAENVYARTTLDQLAMRDSIRSQLNEILGAQSVNYRSLVAMQGRIFALKQQAPKQHRFLVSMSGPDAVENESIVVDPDLLEPKGKVAIDWYHVSPDGKLVAVSLSIDGSEAGDVSIFEVKSGKRVYEIIPGVNAGTAGGGLAWTPDSKGFYYTRYPRGNERAAADKFFYVQLYMHKLGSPTEQDQYELGKDFPRIAEYFFEVDKSGQVLLAVQKGDGGEFMHYFKSKKGTWQKLADYPDQIAQIMFGEQDDLYLSSLKNASRGQILRAPIAGFSLMKAVVVIPEQKDAIINDITGGNALFVHQGRLYLPFQTGGPSEIRVFDLSGKPLPSPQAGDVASVSNMVGLADGDLLFAKKSFLEPTSYFRFAAKTGKTIKTALQEKSPVDLTGVKVLREMARSKDGTQIPLNIILPKGAKPGEPLPFVLNGYGGFGINIEPNFIGPRAALLKAGVGFAVANLRGGSEFGEGWHTAGYLSKKQNVFDDFIAAAEHLAIKNYAAKDRIAIIGGSNGGLLMGAVVTQRPELFQAAVASVGYFDMLRIETEANGQFNTTEYGTVQDAKQFAALYAYSPYHQVKSGTKYPPVLFLVGATDQRVAPWHSRKMLAAMRASGPSGAKSLLLTKFDAGHGMGSSVQQQIEQNTDAFAFMLNHLRVNEAVAAKSNH